MFLLFEYIVRCLESDKNSFHPALLLMFFIGGLCSVLVGVLNRSKWVNKNINIFWQSLISGGIIITGIELVSGIICNLWLKLNIWDYYNIYPNFLGQISVFTSIAWISLTPMVMWLDDLLSYELSNIVSITYRYPLKEIYKTAFNPFGKPGTI